jgi:hypothetical protein
MAEAMPLRPTQDAASAAEGKSSSGAKAIFLSIFCGTAEAVPLTKPWNESAL